MRGRDAKDFTKCGDALKYLIFACVLSSSISRIAMHICSMVCISVLNMYNVCVVCLLIFELFTFFLLQMSFRESYLLMNYPDHQTYEKGRHITYIINPSCIYYGVQQAILATKRTLSQKVTKRVRPTFYFTH